MKVSRIRKGSYVIENVPIHGGYVRVFLNETQLHQLKYELEQMIIKDEIRRP